MMEAVNSFETSVNIHQTTECNFLEDSHLHTRRRENLKSHLSLLCSQEPATRPCPEPDESSPQPNTLFI
jgi:hypothetical protein